MKRATGTLGVISRGPELRARFVLALGGREDRWCPERKALAAQLTERGRR